ncbi:SsrA-binding protein [Galdieria sulphuraria]|nr:SsrA-binding protein [Galdieria sulphuraria]
MVRNRCGVSLLSMATRRKSQYKGPGSTVAVNPIAERNYEILEKFQCGLELKGTEVKSAREGNINLKEGYARVKRGELWLLNVQISPHSTTSTSFNHEPKRPRRLLAHKSEIIKLQQRQQETRLTIIPTRMYVGERNFIKVEVATAAGKKLFDKRRDIKEREQNREIRRVIKYKMYDE